MAAWTLKFDGAGLFGFLHPGRAPATKPAARVDKAAAGGEISLRRAEAMRGLFPKVSAWMARRAYLAEMGAVDRYLSQSTDLFDLECRIRELERRGSPPLQF